jgi:two-component sensor histidine kinase
VAWRGLSDAYRQAVDGHSPWTPESVDPAPIHISDIDTADLSEDLRNTIRTEGIRSLAFIPLLSKGRVIGKFMSYCHEVRQFTQNDLDLGITIARQLGFSIERQQANEQRDLLVAELSHRVKNTLTTVMSIARQTFSSGKDLEHIKASFEARLAALAQTHTRLAETKWTGVSLETMLLDELKPYRREDLDNLQLDGPQVELNPQCAVMLGMVVHELATNAAKYGALSGKEGTVDVKWWIDQETRQIMITWTERGGPTVHSPTRSGFGRLLLERALPISLMGRVDLRYEPGGLQASLEVPLAKALREEARAAASV